MSFHTLRYDLKKTFKENLSKKEGIKPKNFIKGVASSFGNFGDRLTNSNHRHDEEHEKAEDAKREEEKEKHRFKSFQPPIDNNDFKWFVGGT